MDSTFKRMFRNWIAALIYPRPMIGMFLIPRYVADYYRYRTCAGAERLQLVDTHPCLADRTSHTSFDAHYFYQGAWLARCIAKAKPKKHVDVGSSVMMVGVLSGEVETLFIDYRPLLIRLKNLESIPGDITDLQLATNSVESLSCLHVIEHIGLGRYGDPLDPRGSVKAASELQRALKPSGRLYLSVPVGRERVCFNAHRVFAPETIPTLFPQLELLNFSYVSDEGLFYADQQFGNAAVSEYACGMFVFEKNG
jgi:SAM-dependent methyltransferase